MSFQAVSWAFESRLDDPALKLTLVAIASYANAQDETWHSQDKIAYDVGISDRTLRRKLAELQELGFLEVTERRRDDGTKQTSIIRLCREKKSDQPVKLTAGVHRTKKAPTTGQKRGAPPDTKVTGEESKRTERESSIVRVEGPKGIRHIDTDNELPLGDTSDRRPKRTRHQIPKDFAITEEHLFFAHQRGFPPPEARLMFEKFKAYHQGKGSLMLDWNACWRTWVLNQVGFRNARDPSNHTPYSNNPII